MRRSIKQYEEFIFWYIELADMTVLASGHSSLPVNDLLHSGRSLKFFCDLFFSTPILLLARKCDRYVQGASGIAAQFLIFKKII
jgi:hypothetical protein